MSTKLDIVEANLLAHLPQIIVVLEIVVHYPWSDKKLITVLTKPKISLNYVPVQFNSATAFASSVYFVVQFKPVAEFAYKLAGVKYITAMVCNWLIEFNLSPALSDTSNARHLMICWYVRFVFIKPGCFGTASD